MKMKDLSLSERPRERLFTVGPGALSNGELLAILLQSGTKGCNVLDCARILLGEADDSLVQLSRFNLKQFCSVPGIQSRKAAILMACFELGRRFVLENRQRDSGAITCARDIYNMLLPVVKGLGHEECWVLFLNRQRKVIEMQSFGVGVSDSVLVDPKSVVKTAIEYGASALVLSHNHPGGSPLPSKADMNLTEQLQKACSLCEISLLDHVVLCDNSYYSFADNAISSI
ncbi:MAG: DNA repair protein RadC [Candidatus Cryptobacteroides sp.]